MKKNLILTAFTAIFLASCTKDKPVVAENTEVTTTRDGAIYEVDSVNSKIEWKGYKVFKSEQTSHFGTINFESGDLTVHEGNLESGKFVADMTTLSVVDLKDDAEQQGKLEGHLKSGDFFEVEKFPTASFEITKVTKNETGDYNTLLDGNLTIKGITKPIQFNANVSVKDGVATIATEPKDINRDEFNVKFQVPVKNGVISNDVTVQIVLKANEKK